MTKAEIIDRIVTECNISRPVAAQAIECVMDTIREAGERGEDVTLRGFGSFKTIRRKGKMARNLSTGKPIRVPDRRIVKFIPSKEYKQAVAEKA